MLEKTLSILKPDAVERNVVGKILSRYEGAGLRIAATKMIKLSKAEAEGFYSIHKERPFFQSLTTFMSSGPIVVSVLEGEDAIKVNRAIMGATNPDEADEGTIRKEFATDIEKNAVHGSDGPDTAQSEIAYFFSGLDSTITVGED